MANDDGSDDGNDERSSPLIFAPSCEVRKNARLESAGEFLGQSAKAETSIRVCYKEGRRANVKNNRGREGEREVERQRGHCSEGKGEIAMAFFCSNKLALN